MFSCRRNGNLRREPSWYIADFRPISVVEFYGEGIIHCTTEGIVRAVFDATPPWFE